MSDRLHIVDVAVRRDDGKFLAVTNRSHKGWTLPGGKIDPGEEPIQAALRELKEETDLDATKTGLQSLGVFDHKWREFDLRVHAFQVWIEDLEQEPQVVEEGTKFFWAERDALLDEESGCLNTAYYGWLMAKIGWDNYSDE